VSITRIGALLLLLALLSGAGGTGARAQDPTEVAFWSMVKASPRAADIKAYLEAYPRGAYAEAARKRLSELEASPRPSPSAPTPARQVPAPSPLPPAAGGDNRPALTDASTVREVQERLYNLNYEISTINGHLTEETRTAIREWQTNRRRTATGDMTMEELAILRNAKLPTTWGALAYAARGAYAVVWNRPSRQDAVNAALTECRNHNKGGNCKYVSAANNACGALGFYTGPVRSTTYWGAYAIVRPTLGQATELALNECKEQAKRPDVCGIRITFCADGSHQR
jgi:peptidoglycan hydrolase-like protein with peptidoglycan-binding domain